MDVLIRVQAPQALSPPGCSRTSANNLRIPLNSAASLLFCLPLSHGRPSWTLKTWLQGPEFCFVVLVVVVFKYLFVYFGV